MPRMTKAIVQNFYHIFMVNQHILILWEIWWGFWSTCIDPVFITIHSTFPYTTFRYTPPPLYDQFPLPYMTERSFPSIPTPSLKVCAENLVSYIKSNSQNGEENIADAAIIHNRASSKRKLCRTRAIIKGSLLCSIEMVQMRDVGIVAMST